MQSSSIRALAATLVAVAAAAVAILWLIPSPQPAVESLDSSAPQAIDFTAIAMDGHALEGDSLRGKIVLMDFWAVWCGPCVTAVPTLNELDAELAESNFEVVGMAVNSGPVADVKAFAAEHGMEYRVLVGDNDMPYRYDVIGYPTYFLIDQYGNQVHKYVGAISSLEDRIIHDVRELNTPTLP